MDTPLISSLPDLGKFVCSANTAVEFKLIRSIEDLDNDAASFHPEFTHQLFGDTEMIFGYRGLKIKLYFSASKLRVYFVKEATEEVDPANSQGVSADPIVAIINQKMELPQHFNNIDKFVQCLENEADFRPHGEKLHEFQSGDSTYEIYFSTRDTKDFLEYHEQMRLFLLWFIDGASYIDQDDDHWNYFVVFEKTKVNGEYRYYFVGYSTVYNYYAFPEHVRPRISQFLILPPFQKKNIGVNLLKTIYNHYVPNPKVTDITVEDPSDNFCQLLNFVDCLRCLQLASFSKENTLKGWSKDKEEEAKKVLKLHKLQARKVYEVLKLMYVNMNDPVEYKNYRLEVKARLSAPLLKSKKRGKFFNDAKVAQVETMPREVIITELAAAYEELEKEYLKTIKRIEQEV